MLFWILLGLYPAKNTFECLKKPIKGETRHWCIFWLLFASIRTLDPLISFIPFANFFTTLLLFGNYNQQLSELTFKGGLGLTRFWVQKVKANDAFLTLSEKAKRFYKKHNNIINQLLAVCTTTLSAISNLNASVSSAISGALPQVSFGGTSSDNHSTVSFPFVNTQTSAQSPTIQSTDGDDSSTFSLDDL